MQAGPVAAAGTPDRSRDPLPTVDELIFHAGIEPPPVYSHEHQQTLTSPEQRCVLMVDPKWAYLLSKDGGGSAAPLVAALTDRVLRCAVNAAKDRGGRLDSPLLAVLDEAANVCASPTCLSCTPTWVPAASCR